MILFLVFGLACASIAACLGLALGNRRGISAVSLLLFAALPLYLFLGRPDQPSAIVAADEARQRRFQVMQLAEKPFARLEQSHGKDPSALAVMAELNLRLDNREGAQKYYAAAIKAADEQHDPRADVYRAAARDKLGYEEKDHAR